MDDAVPMRIIQGLHGMEPNRQNFKKLKQDTLNLEKGERSEMGLLDQTGKQLQYSPLPGDMEKQALESRSLDS